MYFVFEATFSWRNFEVLHQAASSFTKSSPGVENSIQLPPGEVALFFQVTSMLAPASVALSSVGAAKAFASASAMSAAVRCDVKLAVNVRASNRSTTRKFFEVFIEPRWRNCSGTFSSVPEHETFFSFRETYCLIHRHFDRGNKV